MKEGEGMMVNVNTKSFVDIHTTGKRREFGSIKDYDKFLKENKSYVLTNKELAHMSQPKPQEVKKSDYKKVAEQAWKEREKFVMDVKYGRRKLNGKR